MRTKTEPRPRSGRTAATTDPTRPELDGEACYRAVKSRDARFDGRFVTAVRTTGIYCRPVCPVPPPLEKNVTFLPSAAAAEALGYRPCRRCRPETSPGTPAWIGTSATVSRALRLIADGYLDEHGVEELSDRVGVGPRHLRRLFLEHLGAPPRSIAQTRRVHFARSLIDDTTMPFTRIAFLSGFRSVRQFNDAVRRTFDESPTALRRRTRSSSLGGASSTDARLRLRLGYRPPLDWDHLLDYLRHRATPGVESVADDVYRRVVRVEDAIGVLEARPDPEHATVEVSLSTSLAEHAFVIVERVRRMLDLGADPLVIAETLRADARMRGLVDARPGLRVPGAWEPFELAVRAILGQQVSVTAATTLAGRLAAKFGEAVPEDAGVDPAFGLDRVFPTPEAVAKANVASIGLPRSRAETIRALARTVAKGADVFDASDGLEPAIARLVAQPGIGDWTAQYIAMRGLREPDAFPAGDLGVRKALDANKPYATERAAREAAEAWRPWRAYATIWLWSSLGTDSPTATRSSPRRKRT